MRISCLLILALLLACSADDSPAIKECRLLNMVAAIAGQTEETSYAYNDKNQIVGEIHKRDGVVRFNFVISYTSDGMVDKIDDGTRIIEHTYATDRKIQSINYINKATSSITETWEYTWGPNTLHSVNTKTGASKPSATIDYEFSGENIVHTVFKDYVDFDTDKLSFVNEFTYSNFDAGINQYYLAEHRRPGYSISSKNNYAKLVNVSTNYLDGVIQSTTTAIKNYTYTYNSSNATISFVTTPEGGGVSYTTDVTYDECP